MTDTVIPHRFYLTSAEQAQALDRQTIEDFGIDGYSLMEVAGSRASDHLLNWHHTGEHGLYICGKGNNAGDALVIARNLLQHSISATLVFISGTESLSPDCDRNFKLLRTMDERTPELELNVLESWDPEALAAEYDFIVDGMLGTGLDSDLRGDYEEAAQWVNQRVEAVYAIDIPTGLHADSGLAMGTTVQADATFSFGSLKKGCYLNDGPAASGELFFCDLPFPNFMKKNIRHFLLSEEWVPHPDEVRRDIPRHKYEAGVLYLVAGSEGLTGAAMMAAQSAWSAGLGAVILICPRGILPVFETNLLQVIKKPVGRHEDHHFIQDHADDVLHAVNERPGKVLLGPGLGRREETVSFVHTFLNRFEGEAVIDADGLWALSQREWKKPDEARWILTPHPGELANLLQSKINNDADRLNKVEKFADSRQVTIMSKGYPGIVGTPERQCYITDYDTRIFARAGFGDVLAGKISAFWALGNPPEQSCMQALLDGKLKTEQLAREANVLRPEPIDLI